MRIIHTSDWHLGQNFMGKSRAAEHKAFLDWLLQQVDQQQVDAVIVAGDIFDTGSPPSYAREIYNRFVVALQQYGCQLVVLGGNHDSVATLDESRELLACLNAHVIPAVMSACEEQVLLLRDRHQNPAALVCAIPFIRPRDVMISQAGQSSQDKQQKLQDAIAEHYATVFSLAQQYRDSLSRQYRKIPIIATGHLTTVGASASDSVREIYIGTLDAFPASAFPAADYIALGHIHRSQQVGKSEHIRYSGSPIALSFDETGQEKSVLLVEFDDNHLIRVEPLVIPVYQAMQVIRGDLDSIEKTLQGFEEMATQDSVPQSTWLEIVVTHQDYLGDLQQRIEQMIATLPVEVLRIRRERKNSLQGLVSDAQESLHELDVDEVFERRLQQESWESEAEVARAERLRQHFKRLVDSLDTSKSEGNTA